MGHSPLPPPPQMRNGGSTPAHLPDPSWWLQFKWSQPPPRAPEWLFDYYERYNPPANVGQPLRDEEWFQRAFHEDQQADGLLPPGTSTRHSSSSRPLAPAMKRLPAATGSSTNTPLVLAASALLTLSAFRVPPSRTRAPTFAQQSRKILPPWRLSLC
jgi:hypothetical protein